MKVSFVTSLLILLILSSCSTNSKTPGIETNLNLSAYDIQSIRRGYENQSFTIQDVVSFYIKQIDEIDDDGPMLNAIIQVNPDAMAIAAELDKEMSAGKSRGPLHGIPVVLKDNIDTHDRMETTAGSRALIGSHPMQDSFVAKKLREAGAVILGKANLSEWANFRGDLSSSGWSGVGGQTKNPYVLDRNPCGSSSGSGAAVSANLTVLAIGTETDGSIVCPSHANGIVGIKPTVGLISRSGVVPISFTQDTPGPMARNVRDAAICLGALTGIDPSDSKTEKSESNYYTDYTQFLDLEGIKGKKIGFYTAAMGTNFKVDTLMRQAIAMLKTQGAEVIEIEEISNEKPWKTELDVFLYEYKDGLNKYFASLGPDAPIKNINELIAFNKADSIELIYYNQRYLEEAAEKGDLDSPEYLEALETARRTSQDEGIDRVMDLYDLDAIVAPTGSPAWKTDWVNGDSFQLGSSSYPAIAGYPSITVPMGFVHALPVGISFFGKAWSEPILIEIAYAYEQATGHRKAPEFLETMY